MTQRLAKLAGTSVRCVQRVEREAPVARLDSDAERARLWTGRPAKAEPFRGFVVERFAKDPELISLEILRLAKLSGYQGGKSALYELIRAVRPKAVRLMTRFEGPSRRPRVTRRLYRPRTAAFRRTVGLRLDGGEAAHPLRPGRRGRA